MNELTLADRIYNIARETSNDPVVVMDTYIMKEANIHAKEYAKGKCSLSEDYQEHTLKIMERYARIKTR